MKKEIDSDKGNLNTVRIQASMCSCDLLSTYHITQCRPYKDVSRKDIMFIKKMQFEMCLKEYWRKKQSSLRRFTEILALHCCDYTC